jgi:hypothetical protein
VGKSEIPLNNFRYSRTSLIATAVFLVFVDCGLVQATQNDSAQEQSVSFNRTIRPLLSKNCFACHGPDEDHRESGLRLDERDSAIDSGVIDLDSPAESELVARINSTDPDEVMPPPSSHPQLTVSDRKAILKWIEQGANYEPHWAFVLPVKPDVGLDPDDPLAQNPIDVLVGQELSANGLSPSDQTDPYTLVRRLYLDLIGLPPTRREAFAFAKSYSESTPAAQVQMYRDLVDQLLASPRYGERWARPWLDLARYADTNGYEKDRPRSVWPYRDWVIRSLNQDMPYDQFSVEQLAGDMLPGATEQQKLATGFHRNTMLNEEGGIDPLEFRYHALVDRVATTGIVWMGLTTGCAQCHTHKYDPITHTDFFSMLAFFNNADEIDLTLSDKQVEKNRLEAESKIQAVNDELVKKFDVADSKTKSNFENWKKDTAESLTKWKSVRPSTLDSNLAVLEVMEDDSVFASGDSTKRDVYTLSFSPAVLLNGGFTDSKIHALRIDAMPDERLPAGGPGRSFYEGDRGEFFLSELTATVDGEAVTFASGSIDSVDGTQVTEELNKKRALETVDGNGSSGWSSKLNAPRHLVLNFETPIDSNSELKIELLFERHFVAALGRFKFSFSDDADAKATQLPFELETVFREQATNWDAKQAGLAKVHYMLQLKDHSDALAELALLKEKVPRRPQSLVMQERKNPTSRKTFRHHRGEYQSPREEVQPAIPELFRANEEAGENEIRDRLELAKWLVSENNPLAARLVVNRSWRQFFGRGLVDTDGDFGTQSPTPTHPELLDYLACQFVENGYSMKKLHRSIVTSQTYQQSSAATEELLSKDPNNLLLGRGPRFRVDGETVRDIMLRSSGLLSEKMFGPGVKPPQPNSVTALAYGNPKWEPASGEDRYRRSVYTFAKRTTPFAAFTVFDSPSGENCTAKRNRSNTPLQALTLLNDEMFLEMARAIAVKSESNAESFSDSIEFIFESVLTRPMNSGEKEVLGAFYESQLQRLEKDELNAKQILAMTDANHDGDLNKRAALTLVARAIMNLDEAITKQ